MIGDEVDRMMKRRDFIGLLGGAAVPGYVGTIYDYAAIEKVSP